MNEQEARHLIEVLMDDVVVFDCFTDSPYADFYHKMYPQVLKWLMENYEVKEVKE